MIITLTAPQFCNSFDLVGKATQEVRIVEFVYEIEFQGKLPNS